MNEKEQKTVTEMTGNCEPSNDFWRLQFYAGAFVLDTASGLFYRLTPAAYLLLQAYKAGTQTQQFASLLQRHYGIDPASAARDVELLLNQIASLGLLDNPPQEATA